jgi:hypothetical protein
MKRFGIRITLSPENPLRLPHLLGEDWEAFRWYHSERERDRACEDLQRRLPYYRDGDTPAQTVTKVERGLSGQA